VTSNEWQQFDRTASIGAGFFWNMAAIASTSIYRATFDPRRLLLACATAATLAAAPSNVLGAEAITVVRRMELDNPSPEGAMPGAHYMRLSLGVMRGTGWDADRVLEAARRAVALLAQCAIRTEKIELVEFDGPPRYRTLYTPVSRVLAAELRLNRPAVYFVAESNQFPPFDAEAIGRSNSLTRPEMADSAWIVHGARDLDIIIAHELAHVLADSGEHTTEPGNLMRDETVPTNTRLSPPQCARIVEKASENGLLETRR
jgi:hypothetical protein